MAKLFVWIFVLHLSQSFGFYFDGQPRIIASDGNLLIESAKDRNITFRLQGVASLNVNEKNILNLLHGTDFESSNTANLVNRVAAAEESINDLRTREQSHMARIVRIENGTRSRSVFAPVNNVRFRNLQRRLTRLEAKVERLMTTLTEDNCRSNPCQNGGTCLDMFDGFLCRCPPNWDGTTCSNDVNECAMFAGTELGCQNGATCFNSVGGYSCSCTANWQGLHCTRRNADCASSGSELCGHGSCIAASDSPGYKCICDQGWKTNGVSLACTVDIDECSERIAYCSKDPPVQCINVAGSFMCGLCPAGYSGNGHYCTDIDECEVNNGGCSTRPTVACINTRGSHHCGPCPIGYQGDGKTCDRSSPAETGGDNLCARQNYCHPLATCIESIRGPACICPVGYAGLGIGPMGCIPTAATAHPCTSNPCLNGGSCVSNGTSFTCHCPANTIPPFCSVAFNPCVPSPCQNGGSCTRIRDTMYRCRCSPSFTGNRCEIERSECGGVLNGESGTLKYPLMSSYPHNARCAWLIKTNVTQVLNVTFSSFTLEVSTECRYDWLQIHDGRSSSSHMIGRFCGNSLPMGGNILATTNMLYLWFRSDNTSAHDGFELSWNSIDPICGGTFDVTTHGTISSPGTPGNYPPNRECEWILSAAPGKRIQFQFFTMQLEAHESCQYDFVAIYSGTSISSGVLLSKFCNTSHPAPLTTPYNEVVVQFHSDEAGSDAGFQMHYTVVEGFPGCGGTFTASSGELGPPTQNGVYQKNMLCEYVIQMPLNNRIKIKFTKFELEESSECEFDYVEIFEGRTDKDPKVKRYCGTIIPPDYASLGNELLIVFKSDWSSNFEGFKINYEIICGGIFETAPGNILSPLYPNQYELSRTCQYEILAPLGQAIALSFEDFDIEDTSYPDCDFDFVKIYDGFHENSTELGKYCGVTRPPNAISTLNVMFVVFQSDDSISGRGFNASYSFVDVDCGGVIKSLGHEIKPPKTLGGSYYEHNANCTWIVVAPKGFIVQLTFQTFHLEHSSDCELDYVALYEGTTTKGSKISSYCGSTLPPTIQSTGSVLSLNFVSDSSLAEEGFTATYNFIDSHRICGGTYYAPSGSLTSPGWPRDYLENKDCIYIINAPTGQQIQLSIKTFEMEEHDNCNYDFLEIKNGGTIQSPIIGKYCGTEIPKVIRSHTNQLHIQFKTDSSRGYKGFEMEWDATIMGCGGNVNNLVSGSIVSPNYPHPYGVNTQCDWRITVSKGSTVKLFFAELDLEEHSDCYFDYIEIFDGRSSAAQSFGRFCSYRQLLGKELVSSTNEISFRMVSDVNNQGRGFDLRFDTICTLEIRKHRGAIESPNFPNKYPNNLQCEWKLIAPLGNKIFVAFSQFELEYYDDFPRYASDGCSYDFLQIIQKKSDDDNLISAESYCGKMPKEFTSIGDTIVFRFKTDSSTASHGFHLEYEIQGCGGDFTHPTGNFTSPNYPNAYPHGVNCEWTITTDYGSVIELTFNELDIESSGGCYDHLIVSSRKTYSNSSMFCSQFTKAATITSDGNQFFIKFNTDTSYNGRGFSAYYTTKPSPCGGVFKISKGAFTSPSYPNNYGDNLYCEWYLEVEENHRLQLEFNDFSIENSCEHDFVKIYDGFEKSNKTMATLCGNDILKTTYNSTKNKMLVVMKTDATVNSKGFNAKFRTACGGEIIAEERGVLDIEHFGESERKNCTWTIIAPKAEQHVTLTIVSLKSLDTPETCIFNISIFDGASTAAPIAKQTCVSTHPPPITSSGNALTISITDNYSLYRFSIKAYYSTLTNVCGGTFSDRNGQIASPSYPSSYPLDVECVWELVASPGNQLILTIEKFDIEESEHCNEDYLEIRENGISGKLLGVYCGNNVPTNIPPAERYWLKFKSDSDGVGTGFLAQYVYATSIEIGGSSGVITSPLYPHIFPVFTSYYAYRITVKFGYFISLVVKEFLTKTDDSITVHDGYDSTAPAQEIKDVNVDPIVSSSNVLYISFGGGYFSEIVCKLEWNELSTRPELILHETETTNCTSNSVVYLRNDSLVAISSPGYPYGYDVNQNCTWTLKSSDAAFHAGFVFTELDLEDSVHCLSDYVRISSSKDLSEYKQLNRSCQMPPNNVFTVHGNPYLRLNFISDYYNNRTGFTGLAKQFCGAPMSGSSGVIRVVDELSCEWEITVRRGRKIKFEFLKLDISSSSNECISYVLIRNGASKESPFLGQGKYCGTTIPTIETTSSNRAFIEFKKYTRTLAFASFTLQYDEVMYDCGGTVMFNGQNSTIITSPNYPHIPPPHIECIWSIIVPTGERIQVDFIQPFGVTFSNTCDQEYVELRDGGTVNGIKIGTFCGKIPETKLSISNMLRIKYYTDISVPMNGFQANISLAKCGGFYRSKSGYVQSSHYPGLGAYDKNSVCEYRIISSEGVTLNITFIDLNLPYADNCNDTDHVEIYSKKFGDDGEVFDEIGKYCGADTLPEPILTSSEVLVKFITNQPNSEFRGFRLSYNSSVENCGGEIVAESGYVTSPGYPIGRPYRQYCEWRIKVPKGRRVKADILDFDFEQQPVIQEEFRNLYLSISQSLSFYNDFLYSSRIIRMTQNQTSEPIYSSDNLMMISLWLKHNTGHRGFKIRFSSDEPSICVGDLNADEGVIESPKNVSLFACDYVRDQSKPLISGNPGTGTIGIYMVEISTAIGRCSYLSPLSIQYNPTSRPQFFSATCNATTELTPIASPFSSIKISGKRGAFYTGSGAYTINYKIHNCGKLISNTQATTIRNPEFPANYGRVACGWQFLSVENAPIVLSGHFQNLKCGTEYIAIHSSSYPTSLRKKTLCGEALTQIPLATVSHATKSIFIEYHSLNYNPNTTFQLDIKSNYNVCGGLIEYPVVEFSSPLNSSQYPNNIECIWDISTSIGYHIGLTFINRFFVETSVNCTNDYIEILDNVDNEWKLMSRLCGRTISGPFNSTGTRMRVIFRTNENVSGEGFTVKWERNCGGVFLVTKDSQILTSPGFPQRYPSNIKCNYTLLAEKEDFVNVDFDEFNLEITSRACGFDNLTIFKYDDWSYPPGSPTKVGVYCWPNSLHHIRYKHKIDLLFSSDSYIEKTGFSLRYYLDNCGGNITNSSMIEVPQKEAGKYADFLTCYWYIKAQVNQKIVIRFEYFDIEHNDGCYLDSVEVFQGLKDDIQDRKAILCGNLTQHAPIINIDSNNAIVKFHSDSSTNVGGFSALILMTEKCDKSIELNGNSPSYKLNKVEAFYGSNLDCHYVITAPEGYVLKMEFDHFHLAYCRHDNTSCNCDYLSIFDGSDAFAEAIQKNICGHDLPQPFTTSGPSLFIRYVTDSVVSSSGFSANIRIEPAECGATFIRLNSSSPEQYLSWPLNSGNNRANARCDWNIEAPDGEQIEIHFEKFELRDADSASQCSFEYLQLTDSAATFLNSEGLGSQFIYSGGKSRVIRPFFYWGRSFPAAPHTYCGAGIPDDFISNSKSVSVRFRGDSSSQKSGFKFVARMTPACHRNYTSLQGRLFSKKLEDCETFITVPENNTISLFFSILNVYLTDYNFKCTVDNAPMKIFDQKNNRLIQHVCPGAVPNPIFANTSSLRIKSNKMDVSWTDTNGAYDITYLASDKGLGCGGQIFNYAGVFSSPLYPVNDRNLSDCRWDITVPQNLVVAISFNVFDMGSKVTCPDNYLQIIETDITGKETVARQYCGNDVPSTYKSMRNILTIKFKKTTNFAGSGWLIHFMSIHPSATLI